MIPFPCERYQQSLLLLLPEQWLGSLRVLHDICFPGGGGRRGLHQNQSVAPSRCYEKKAGFQSRLLPSGMYSP
jgi:hypothetical protein